MSLASKIAKAALKSANIATLNERARCLWVLDAVLEDLREKLPKVFLNETARHIQQTKIKIAMAIIDVAKRNILNGLAPTEEPGGSANATEQSGSKETAEPQERSDEK